MPRWFGTRPTPEKNSAEKDSKKGVEYYPLFRIKKPKTHSQKQHY